MNKYPPRSSMQVMLLPEDLIKYLYPNPKSSHNIREINQESFLQNTYKSRLQGCLSCSPARSTYMHIREALSTWSSLTVFLDHSLKIMPNHEHIFDPY